MRDLLLKDWLNCKGIKIPQLYLVGGTVRDLFRDLSPKDIDLVCRGAKEFAAAVAGCKNAALVPMEKKPEEPCYRVVDREDSGNFLDIAEMRGETIYDDLYRRDFTINAIALELNEDGSTGAVIDPLDGAGDVERKTLRMAGDKSILSDPLRILRAVRFAAGLEFMIEESTLKEMRSRAALLRNVSAERVRAELLRILQTSRSVFYFRQMDELGILEVIFPEISAMKGCPQDGFHHRDVWGHSLLVMEHSENVINDLSGCFGEWSGTITDLLARDNRLPLLKLAAVLHDSGKPATRGLDPDTGRITFYRHDEEGAKLIGLIAERLKMSCRERDFMVLMAAEHLHALYLVSGDVKTAALMKWFRRMRDDSIPAIILSMADTMSSLGPDSSDIIRGRHIDWAKRSVMEYYGKIKAKIESPGLVNGDDLIALGMQPGPEMGRILEETRSFQDAGEIKNREEALELVRRLMTSAPPFSEGD